MNIGRSIINFAVGDPSVYYSAIWSLWIDKYNNVYLTTKGLAGTIKLSLHQSGIWRLAYVRESGIKVPGTFDRVEKRWERPSEFKQGWILGPSVIIPFVDELRPFKQIKSKSAIRWIPRAKVGNKHHITILFADSAIKEENLLDILASTDTLLGILQLNNGSRVLLSQRELPMTQNESSLVASYAKNVEINFDSMPVDPAASVYVSGSDDKGNPYILDIPLGWKNVNF